MIVNNTNSNFSFRDVTLVQPSADGVKFGQAEFKDYVVVEATKDGVTWVPLKDGYNSSFNPNWLTAYNSNQTGTQSLEINQEINIRNTFAANDTLLFRFRLKSNNTIRMGGDGRLITFLSNNFPTSSTESRLPEASVFPNPSTGKAMVRFTLTEKSTVAMAIVDASGKQIYSVAQQVREKGEHEYEIDLSGHENGLYLVQLNSNQGNKAIKLLIRR